MKTGNPKDTPKRRNPVASAAKRGAGGRGGAMVDRKKARDLGYRKHKGRPHDDC